MSGPQRPGDASRGRGRAPPSDLRDAFGFQARMLHDRVLKHLAYEPPAHVLAEVPVKALIACTARSGSSLMSAALERYGLAFQEYLNPEGYVKQAAGGRTDYTVNDFARRLRDHAVRGGVLAVKSSPLAILYLAAFGEAPERMADWRIVFLRRRNAVRQAISAYIAERTGVWTSTMVATAEITDADYDFDRILALADVHGANNERWERFFGLYGLTPLRVFYEDYVADLAGGTEAIARFIGVDLSAHPFARDHKPRFESQSSTMNADWEARFRAELLRRGKEAVAQATRSG